MKSKLKYWVLFAFFLLLFLTVVIAHYILIEPLTRNIVFIPGITISVIFIVAVFLGLKDYKYLVVNREKRTLTWYSLYRPLGWRKRFEDYKYIIRNIDYNAAGVYPAMYLVGKDMYTKVRFTGYIYKNFDDLFNAIDLPEIKSYRFGVWLYFKLIFTGRIKIVE